MRTIHSRIVIIAAICAVVWPWPVMSQIVLPTSDVSDGAFNVASGTTNNVDLSLAATAAWTAPSPVSGQGVYDSNQWAVVFKYSSVTIANGATVTFKNHPSRAPVVWLVNGDVTINGVLSLNGQDWSIDIVNLPEGGPGGFRGGARKYNNSGNGSGFGPGGGDWSGAPGGANPGSGHGIYGGYYGNPQIVPLIGGSGGGAHNDNDANGSAGGGAILIAATGAITIDGRIQANAGARVSWGGSGGAIRLLANAVTGSGRVEANGPYPGRIRIEANTVSSSLSLNPLTIGVPPVPVTIFPSATAPSVRVVSVAGQSAPLDPHADMKNGGDDLTLTNTGPIEVVIETRNMPTNSVVTAIIKPRNNSHFNAQAQYTRGDNSNATWTATANAPLGHFIVQVRAVTP